MWTQDLKGAKANGLALKQENGTLVKQKGRKCTIRSWKSEKGSNRGAQRKEDRKKYWQSLDIHISHPTRPACSLYFIELHWAGGTAWQASSFNGKYGPSLASRLALSHYSCFLSIPPDIILSPLQQALSLPSFSPPVLALSLVFYLSPIMFHSPVSIHLYVALLIPSHLLSSALISPISLPALPEPFPQLSHFHLPVSVFLHSSWFISSLLVVSSIPLPSTCTKNITIPLYSGLSSLHLAPNSSALCGSPHVFSFTCAVLLSLFKAQGHIGLHMDGWKIPVFYECRLIPNC